MRQRRPIQASGFPLSQERSGRVAVRGLRNQQGRRASCACRSRIFAKLAANDFPEANEQESSPIHRLVGLPRPVLAQSARRARSRKRAAVAAVDRHAADLTESVRPDLGFRGDRAARTSIVESAGGLRRTAGLHGDAQCVGHAHGVRGLLRQRQAHHRHHGRVRRATRRFAEGAVGKISAGRRRRGPWLRAQPVRRGEPGRGARDQGTDRGRQTQGHHPVSSAHRPRKPSAARPTWRAMACSTTST